MTTARITGSGNLLERVRRGNLGRVLTRVHEDGPLSRADLTRATELNRSTVSALVGELVSRGLVTEGRQAATGVGRPSPTVTAASSVVALALNPEVDALTLAVVGLDGTEHHRVRRVLRTVPTPARAASLTEKMIADLGDVFRGRHVVGLGVALPGIVRADDGFVRIAPHLGWRDEPFAQRLADRTGLRVSVGNDADLGAISERLAGTARRHRDIAYLNGGASGIGSGIIVNGEPLRGVSGYAGELGHTRVQSPGRDCHCGSTGCLETVVSQALLLEAAGPPQNHRGTTPLDQLAAALAAPSPRLAAEVENQLRHLATALRSVIVTVNPGMIVLGGFLGSLRDHTGTRLMDLVAAETVPVLMEDVVITTARLGPSSLVRGAAELAFRPLLRDPITHLDAMRAGRPPSSRR
ncbi:MAG: ROK family transcriptional regulator [Lapillicoccus sp.]